MKNREYDIINSITPNTTLPPNIQTLLESFVQQCTPIENILYVFIDAKIAAYYCECHLMATNLIKLCTIDVPLDPEEQAEYRANREIVEDDVAFEQMKTDAKDKRTFSNIVGEYDTSHDPKHPIKIIGGQHRYIAVKGAHEAGTNVHHGVKIYFGLNKDQRLDVQLISNTNIDVSSDLYDRLQETAVGPQLRNWSQGVGFLDPGKDFSAKRLKGSAVTVRSVRSFILGYYKGTKLDPSQFENLDTTPSICRTGRPDTDWDTLRKTYTNLWTDEALRTAAQEFVILDQAQRIAIQKMYAQDNTTGLVYEDKALTFSVMTAWAYVAGVLQSNNVRLQRHYDLKNATKDRDPLNTQAMSKGRHKSDPENYRGLGTRNDSKERGRCVELFYLQAEKGSGITAAVVDAAIKRHYTKQAKLEQLQAEKKVE